jgi:SCY1-like protein 1
MGHFAPKVGRPFTPFLRRFLILCFLQLTDRLLNNDLLRLLAKMQMDSEPSIRTNTCILLGRLGPTLGYNTKRKVLVPAFSRALKDSFVHARVAGLMAFMATIDCFEMEELATKVIPNMSITLVDKEKFAVPHQP